MTKKEWGTTVGHLYEVIRDSSRSIGYRVGPPLTPVPVPPKGDGWSLRGASYVEGRGLFFFWERDLDEPWGYRTTPPAGKEEYKK